MRWLLALLVGVVALAGPAVRAVAAPPAPAPVEVRHGFATPPVAGSVQRGFVPPPSPYAAGHRGVDLAASAGEPVAAAMGGVVSFSGGVAGVGWVTVDHGGGLDTTYGPLSPRAVAAGDHVAQGSLLGFIADGAAHLDWGARLEGEYIDPLTLLGRWETYLTTIDGPPDPSLLAAAAAVTRRGAHGAPSELRRPAVGAVTSGFGPRRHPVTGQQRHHAGVDIAAPSGAPVRAATAGTVSFAGTASGYGRTVIIDHGSGLTTLYAHLSSTTVRPGQPVTAGARVGAVGSTGLSTGPHLHFEVRVDGRPQDPSRWL